MNQPLYKFKGSERFLLTENGFYVKLVPKGAAIFESGKNIAALRSLGAALSAAVSNIKKGGSLNEQS
jgi:hypothetical protein